MVFIKTTNVIEDQEIKETIRKVQCPYCKIHMKSIPEYVVSMICWNKNCQSEFRIEKDSSKHKNCLFGGRTMYQGVIK